MSALAEDDPIEFEVDDNAPTRLRWERVPEVPSDEATPTPPSHGRDVAHAESYVRELGAPSEPDSFPPRSETSVPDVTPVAPAPNFWREDEVPTDPEPMSFSTRPPPSAPAPAAVRAPVALPSAPFPVAMVLLGSAAFGVALGVFVAIAIRYLQGGL